MTLDFIIAGGKTCVVICGQIVEIQGYETVLTFVKSFVFDVFAAHQHASAIAVKASYARMQQGGFNYFEHSFE